MNIFKKVLIISLSLFFIVQQVSADVFSDVASNHPNFTAINYLHDNGVIEGYPDNTFRPDQTVNRAEALKIILLGSSILVPEIQAQEIFPDVLSDTWYGKYAAKAKNLGIVKGDDSTGNFRPGDTVNLAEALKILLKADNKDSVSPSSAPYADVPADAWFAPFFDYAQKANLLDQSSQDNVNPATPITRGMLAELMYRLVTSTFLMPDGKASYYGAAFHGKTTASGEIFDASALTAANKTYPFGTYLKVTNTANLKSVVVKINDRGPYTDDATRIIDLSQAAFEKIAALSSGIINVKIEETSAPSETTTNTDTSADSTVVTDLLTGDLLNQTKVSCPDTASLEYISKNIFSGITLDEEIPNRFLLSEVLTITGTTTSKTGSVTAFLVDSNDSQTAFTGKIESGRFSVSVRFPKEGTFQLGIVPGESGTSVIKEVKALKNTCIEEVESSQLKTVTGLDFSVKEGDMDVQWNLDGYNLFKLTFSQGGLHQSYYIKDIFEFKPFVKDFKSFKTGDVEVSLRGANLTKNSLIEPAQIVWSPAVTKSFIAGDHYEYLINDTEAELVSLTSSSITGSIIKAVIKPKVPVRAEGAIILPEGSVKDVALTSSGAASVKNAAGIEVFPSSGETLTLTYTAKTTGVHILEINDAEGLAVLNVPIYIKNQYPLIPNTRDLSAQLPEDLGTNMDSLRSKFLSLVNADRAKYGLGALKTDDNLNSLAQYRSDDMVANSYFSHWDKQGRDANDLRLNYGIQAFVGENLAKDINLELAEYGLMRSPIHRSNILSSEWKRVGFGISKLSDGSYIFVQIFSENPLDTSDLTSLRTSILNKINESRSSSFTQNDTLNTVAQSWSEKMASEDFFDFTSKSGASLIDSVRSAGVNASIGTYIVGNSSFGDALIQIGGNSEIRDSKWKGIGIGVKQDNLGIIKITIIYSE